MPTIENRQPDGVGTGGGSQFKSSSGAKIISLPTRRNCRPFDDLTVSVALARLRAGTLEPGVLVALLAAVGVRP